MTSLLVFAANVLTDVLAVLFIKCVTSGHRIRAGLVSISIVVLSYFSIIYIVADAWFIIPAAMGAFVGCWLTVGRKK
ncbi:MAG: hypothetical protein IMZ61_11130 [Planctomycetes bacterium]|nr:hypothetical protein [Planctomycetota bacterium]